MRVFEPGSGVAVDSDSGRAFATTAGVLRLLDLLGECLLEEQSHHKTSALRTEDEVRVENLRKRYVPRQAWRAGN